MGGRPKGEGARAGDLRRRAGRRVRNRGPRPAPDRLDGRRGYQTDAAVFDPAAPPLRAISGGPPATAGRPGRLARRRGRVRGREDGDPPVLHGPCGPRGPAGSRRRERVSEHARRSARDERTERGRPDPEDGRTGRERTLRRPEGRATRPPRGAPRHGEPGDLAEQAEGALLEPIWRPMGLYRPLERGLGHHPGGGRPGRGPAPALAARRGGSPRADGPGGPARGLGRTPGLPLGRGGQRS